MQNISTALKNEAISELIEIDECNITRIIRYDNNSGEIFMQMRHGDKRFYATGITCPINPGAFYKITGTYEEGRLGKIFRFKDLVTLYPRQQKMAVEFLSYKGFCPGLPRKTAESIVDSLGDDAISMIARDPSCLSGIKGVGAVLRRRISDSIKQARGAEEAFRYLYRFGINAHDSFQLYCRYRADTIARIATDPYGVAEENDGIYPFATADNIALSHGLDEASPFRVRAGIKEALRQGLSQGHSFLYLRELLLYAEELLVQIRPSQDKPRLRMAIAAAIEPLEESGAITRVERPEGVAIYFPEERNAELDIARMLPELAFMFHDADVNADIPGKFSDEQKAAIIGALSSPFSVITGGPGTGKTTVMAEIVRLHKAAGRHVLLASPTAKAADRMSEVTGMEATTIQRMLGYRPFGGYLYNEKNHLDADVVIVDEFSMVDLLLMRDLVAAIAPGTILTAIGDEDQLPSVGAGNVLADLLGSDVFNIYALTRIFRQGSGSSIPDAAKAINNGKRPAIGNDFILKWCAGDELSEMIKDIVFDKIPNNMFIPSEKIRVITPLRKGERGSLEYSNMLREVFNPPKGSNDVEFMGFRVGDQVMQVKNNYRLGAMNGDEGIVERISLDGKALFVRFREGELVEYRSEDIRDGLETSYCITVHKSQGSEYPAVVIALPPESRSMMNRRLLYTAVTRAKRLVVIAGSKEAMLTAISTHSEVKRNSGLRDELRKACPWVKGGTGAKKEEPSNNIPF